MKTKKAPVERKAKTRAPAVKKASKPAALPPEIDAKALFARLSGEWEGTAKTWFEPNKLAEESPVEGTIRAGAGGLVAVHQYKGTLTGNPMEGTALFGYDTRRRVFTMAWADNCHQSSNVMWSEGPADPDGNGFSVLGGYSYGPEKWGWRTRVSVAGADDVEIRHYNITPKGEEALGVEVKYRRKVAALPAPEPEIVAETPESWSGIEQKRLTVRRFVGMRRKVAPAALGATLGEILPAVAGYLKGRSVAPVSMPAMLYMAHDEVAGRFEILGGFFVGKSLRVESGFEAIEVPTCDAAVTIHAGPYDKLGDTHNALRDWIRARGREAAMPCWEVYVTDPGTVQNPAEWKTEVVMPMK